MSTMYGAHVGPGAYLRTGPTTAFDFGVGDFTLSAMIMGTGPGDLVSHWGSGSAAQGGALLWVGAGGVIGLSTSSGTLWSGVKSESTSALDGSCHVLTAIRKQGDLQVFLDAKPVPLAFRNNEATRSVSNGQPLTIGCTPGASEPHPFTGMIMNVGVWNLALDGEALIRAQFGRVAADEPGLQGYWRLDGSGADLSRNGNNAQSVGPVSFLPCIECVWASGASDYSFCQMTHTADVDLPEAVAAGTLTMTRQLTVPPEAPGLCAGILAEGDTPAFPAGATVSLTDPGGKTYNSDENTNTAFVHTVGGQLWSAAIVAPKPGTWRLVVTVPASVSFALTMHTVPSTAVVPSITDALRPLYGASTATTELSSLGWGEWLATVAVSALVAVVLVATEVVPPVVAVIAVVAIAYIMAPNRSRPEIKNALSAVNSKSVPEARKQIAGMTCFIVSADKVLLVDQNNDTMTNYIYETRNERVYAEVTASKFNAKQQSLIGPQDSRLSLAAALSSFSAGYVSICGHGRPRHITGWFVSGTSGPSEEVLTYDKYAPAESKGKIFHALGCSCGDKLGPNLVRNGAVAFFGYDVDYQLNTKYRVRFVDCASTIDEALLAGKTCAQAYEETIAALNAAIRQLSIENEYGAAGMLKTNRDHLVAPSTSPAYGDKSAILS